MLSVHWQYCQRKSSSLLQQEQRTSSCICSPPWHSPTVVINKCAISTFAIRLDDIRPLNPKNIGAIVGVEGGRGTGKPSAPALKYASSFLASKAASQSGQLGSF
jgi:hypothetical protein